MVKVLFQIKPYCSSNILENKPNKRSVPPSPFFAIDPGGNASVCSFRGCRNILARGVNMIALCAMSGQYSKCRLLDSTSSWFQGQHGNTHVELYNVIIGFNIGKHAFVPCVVSILLMSFGQGDQPHRCLRLTSSISHAGGCALAISLTECCKMTKFPSGRNESIQFAAAAKAPRAKLFCCTIKCFFFVMFVVPNAMPACRW